MGKHQAGIASIGNINLDSTEYTYPTSERDPNLSRTDMRNGAPTPIIQEISSEEESLFVNASGLDDQM